jgi:class 3 adenylate cyclase
LAQYEIEEIQKAIETLENQRALLGNDVVDTAVAPLREKLAAVETISRSDQQRKLVTTLFLNVVNSTAMVRDMDLEDHLAIMDEAIQRQTVPIEANGGRVIKYMGDGLMALFGHPTARENDPELAVRAALNMLELAQEYAPEVKKQWAASNRLTLKD